MPTTGDRPGDGPTPGATPTKPPGDTPTDVPVPHYPPFDGPTMGNPANNPADWPHGVTWDKCKDNKEESEAAADGHGGYIKYGDLDDRFRPTGVEARITPGMIGTGSKANDGILPPGFEETDDDARGHLLGNQLGGSGDVPENLVTLFQNPVNTPNMSDIERDIRNIVESGTNVIYQVTPHYTGDNPVPDSVTISAKDESGKSVLVDADGHAIPSIDIANVKPNG